MTEHQWLVALDTDHIKSYLFASPRLAEIRGASHFLDRLNREEKFTKKAIIEACPDADVIYCAGGSALAVVPTLEDADAVIVAVEALYRRETMTASITGASWKMNSQLKFGENFREVSYVLRARKEEKLPELYLPIEGSIQPCPSCGEHPISTTDEVIGERICRACAIKRYHGRREARGIYWQKFMNIADPAWTEINVRPAGDLGDVGGASRPSNYIGLIYGDGNNMGKKLWKLEEKEQFRNFAHDVDQFVGEAVLKALDRKLQPRPNSVPIAPFEIFLMGGDDFVLAVPGHNALDIAATIAENIETNSKRLSQFTLSVGVGVVIAHQNFPLATMFDLALELQKQAKGKSFEEHDASAIDFIVISAPSTRGVGKLRDTTYTERVFRTPPQILGDEQNGQHRVEFRLTRRPYTRLDLQKLLEHARRMRRVDFPNGRLRTLEAALFTSEATAMREAQTALGRGKAEHRDLLEQFFREFEGIRGPDYGVPPWFREKKDYYVSALADLAEIYPFIH